MRLLTEAAAKKFEREHNSHAWLAWHIAAMSRTKKLPPLSKLIIKQTAKPRQTWRQQLGVMAEWAGKHNNWVEARNAAIAEGLIDGR